jgi:pimeloyl-ACP methyl ester carboxylesterase
VPVRPPSIAANAAAVDWVEGAGGVRLRRYRLCRPAEGPATAPGPVLLWGHANGFAAGSYLPWLQQVSRYCTVYAYDARGHGGADLPPEPLSVSCRADALAADLAAVAAAVRAEIGPQRPLHFAAHSFTGLAALRLGGVHGAVPWTSATLFEPPLAPTPDHAAHAIAAELAEALVTGALRRRPVWDSPAALGERLAASPAYARWDRAMLAAHCAAILHPAADGRGWGLASPPAVEAAGYRMTMDTSTFRFAAGFACPNVLVASQPAGEGATPSWAALVQGLAAARVPAARLVRLADCGHMMLFERPDACLAELLAAIDRSGRA